MNRDVEAVKNLIFWLIQDPSPSNATPSGEISDLETGSGQSGYSGSEFNGLDSLSADEISDMLAQFSNTSSLSSKSRLVEGDLLFELGDIPAVQDRFYALLKRRLQAEIESNPPLFPWESEVCDYEAEYSDLPVSELVPANFWATQLKNLSLPVPMPDALLTTLLSQCQEAVQSSLRQGARLVQAVEPLFPGRAQTLNHLAGLVISSDYLRSAAAPALESSGSATAEFPNHYDAANPIQQMALSLVAAREIMDSLSLVVSPEQPKSQQKWLTSAGAIVIEAEYQSQPRSRLKVHGQLPCQGTIHLRSPDAQSTAQRSTPGWISLELVDVEPNAYPLEIQLKDSDKPPLTFVIQLSAPLNR
ncbi:MAG TPA: PatU [Elainellaceae cyanobacterium]